MVRIVKFHMNRYCTTCAKLFSRPAKLIIHNMRFHGISKGQYLYLDGGNRILRTPHPPF
jgi:hypothetical protein